MGVPPDQIDPRRSMGGLRVLKSLAYQQVTTSPVPSKCFWRHRKAIGRMRGLRGVTHYGSPGSRDAGVHGTPGSDRVPSSFLDSPRRSRIAARFSRSGSRLPLLPTAPDLGARHPKPPSTPAAPTTARNLVGTTGQVEHASSSPRARPSGGIPPPFQKLGAELSGAGH